MILLLTRFLHVLVFVYWLGGDLGAFYSAGLLTDRRRATEGRLAAAQVLFRVDLAPNTALILAAPTGLALALAKGWLAFNPLWLVPIWLVALAWLIVSWRLHLIQRPQPRLSKLDFWVRCGLILILVSLGGSGLAGMVSLPLFLSLKLLILAAATVLGLIVRHFLKAFTPAFMALATGGGTAETDDVIADALGKSRYAVLGIWDPCWRRRPCWALQRLCLPERKRPGSDFFHHLDQFAVLALHDAGAAAPINDSVPGFWRAEPRPRQ